VGLSEGQRAVFRVEGLGSPCPHIVVDRDGLTTTADTSAGARHDFDEVILDFTFFYPFKKFPGVTEAVRYGNTNISNTTFSRVFPVTNS
jgi:hypothetical protein